MKKDVVLLVYGEGGHKAQMKRLYNLMLKANQSKDLLYIGVCENSNTINELYENYTLTPLRDKHNNIRTIFKLPKNILDNIKLLFSLKKKYNVVSVISTGPGISILISLFFKTLGKKIIFIETWSRFETQSMTGKVMYKIADKFYIQNKSLQKYYPKAIYGGLL